MSLDPIAEPVDHIVLGGQRSPGTATIQGAELVRRLRERRAFGVAGATVVDQGAQLCHFEVVLKFTTSADFRAWDAFKALLVRPAQRSTQGVDIEHPLLEDLEIRSVLPEGRSQFVQDDNGGQSVTLKFCEFRRPVPVLAVPDTTVAHRPPNGSPEQDIENLTAEFDRAVDPESYPAGAS